MRPAVAPQPRGVQRLFEAIDEVPRARAELLEISGLAEDDWPAAIDFIVDHGMALRTGTKRWTRYSRSVTPRSVDPTAEPASSLEERLQGDAGSSPTDPVTAILSVLDEVPRARSDILVSAGVPDSVWSSAIDHILAAGLAERTGSKRGTRYTRTRIAGSSPTTIVGGATPLPDARGAGSTGSAVAVGYHDLVFEALEQLERRIATEPTVPAPERNPDEWLSMLLERGIMLFDLRERGGCLWVVDCAEARSAIKLISARAPVRFFFAASSRACGGRPAWWTRD